jgi:nitrogen fixation protein NifB
VKTSTHREKPLKKISYYKTQFHLTSTQVSRKDGLTLKNNHRETTGPNKKDKFRWKKRVPDTAEINFSHITEVHPCFNTSTRHSKNGRIHLPVAPECNIQCNFCVRSINETEFRPGVAFSIINPEEAMLLLQKAIQICPEISVVGIAGPGDPLATNHAIETFTLVDQNYPHLIKCLSTNGLELEEKAKQLADLNVKTVTVSVHAVDPRVASKIYSQVQVDGKLLRGIEASDHLIRAQLFGIEEATERGLIVKVNTVLIPGINQNHIESVARAVHKAGASIINIIPLIPQYKLNHKPPPTCEQLNQARQQMERIMPAFRHCQRCRADAVGTLDGKDFSKILYEKLGLPFPKYGDNFSHG